MLFFPLLSTAEGSSSFIYFYFLCFDLGLKLNRNELPFLSKQIKLIKEESENTQQNTWPPEVGGFKLTCYVTHSRRTTTATTLRISPFNLHFVFIFRMVCSGDCTFTKSKKKTCQATSFFFLFTSSRKKHQQ